jgi:hypothetical protein
MTDLEKFNLHWKFEGQRAKATQEKYEQILFSIWKNHRDWKDDELHNGFQIKCWNRTFYKVVETAMKAGLLIMAGNYSVDNHTRIFHKNNVLFDMIFRDSQNKYGNWLDKIRKVKTDTEDIITQSYIYETDNIKIPYVEAGLKNLIPKRRLKKLPYDIEKLYNLSNTMLPHYHQLLLRLNNAASNSKLKINSNFNLDDFKLKSFLYFDQQGLPKGRPWSYFCSTLNENKEHKRIDTGFEFRNDFLRKVGLGDYYEVYDIKSEIPRVNYLFHTGIWKDDDYDFYTEIIKDTEMLKYTGDEIERGTAGTKYYNDSMKQLFMRIYFGRGSDLQSYNAYIIEKKSRLENEYELWLFEKRLRTENWLILIYGKSSANLREKSAELQSIILFSGTHFSLKPRLKLNY